MDMAERLKAIMAQKQAAAITEQDKATMEQQTAQACQIRVQPHTVAILETILAHGEVYPSVIKYFLDLGFNVHFYGLQKHQQLNSTVNCRFDTAKFQDFYFSKFPANEAFFKHLCQYDYVWQMTIFTQDGYQYITALEQNYLQKYHKNNLFCINHELMTVDNPADTVEKHFLDNRKTFVLRNGIMYKGQELPFTSPLYFGEYESLIKNKNQDKTVFLSVGGMWKKNLRNFSGLFDALQKLQEKEPNFEVIFVGIDKETLGAKIPESLKEHIKIMGKVSYEILYHLCQTANFLLFNMDSSTTDYAKYLTRGISGTYSLSLGFRLPAIIYRELGQAYGLDDSKAVSYTDDTLADALFKATQTDNETYINMQTNLDKTAKELANKSLNNIKEILNVK